MKIKKLWFIGTIIFAIINFVNLYGCVTTTPSPLPVGQQAIETSPDYRTQSRHYEDSDIRTGSLITLEAPAFPGKMHARVGQSYQSALGRPCFRLTLVDVSTPESVAICREDNGSWLVAPRLFHHPSDSFK